MTSTRSLTIALGLVLHAALAAGPARANGRVAVLRLEGTIQPGSLRFLERALGEAREAGVDAVLIELDTPGGLLVSLRDMTTAITGSGPPVIVYVAPAGARGASAGFFLLMAADVAAMAPGTNAGAAHPVAVGGGEAGRPEAEKAAQDAAALVRSLAAQRGRSVEWADKAVRESLSYSEREALEKDLIDLVASDRSDLLARLDGRAVRRFDGHEETLRWERPEIVEIRPSAGERLLMTIADPDVAYLLFMLGILGLLFELMSPGAIVPGVIGALGLLLAFYAFSVIPVNYVGALLLVLAVGLFVAEAFVTSYGLLTLAGLAAFVLGSLVLVDTPIPEWRVGLALVVPTAAVLAGVSIFLLSRVARSRRRRALTGAEGLVGEIGEVVVPLDPEGKVFVHGEYWNAIGPEPLRPGTRVRVVRLEHGRLEVQPVSG